MSNKINIQGYIESVNSPWGQLFYQMVWHNIECSGKKILDFGSGFGISADHFAKNNEVTAIEPNEEMLEHRVHTHAYIQLVGSIEQLRNLPDHSYDLILCHNVLEYLDCRDELFLEFSRILKPDGMVSILKHNKAGKVMQKAVFEYNVEEAIQLIHQENVASVNFGLINEYENCELEQYGEKAFVIDHVYGVRMFFALQRNEIKKDPDWMTNMFRLECEAEEVKEFRDIAFFHHVILKPNQ